MTLQYNETPDVIFVFFSGSMYVAGPEIYEAFERIQAAYKLAVSTGKRLIIDFRGVDHINSAVLLVLFRLNKRSAVDLRIANAGANIQEVLRITKLDKVFRFDSDVPDLFGAAVPLPNLPAADSGRADQDEALPQIPSQ